MDDVVRMYIRYTLNGKQFNPDVVLDLIRLRKASMFEDNEVAEILNQISRRIVREKVDELEEVFYEEVGAAFSDTWVLPSCVSWV